MLLLRGKKIHLVVERSDPESQGGKRRAIFIFRCRLREKPDPVERRRLSDMMDLESWRDDFSSVLYSNKQVSGTFFSVISSFSYEIGRKTGPAVYADVSSRSRSASSCAIKSSSI